MAPESLAVLADLLHRAASPGLHPKTALTILPGSGINNRTVSTLLDALLPHGLTEIHLSGGEWVPSTMRHRREGMGMGTPGAGEWGTWRTQKDSVRAVKASVDVAAFHFPKCKE